MKQTSEDWLLSEAVGLDAPIHLAGVDSAIPLAEIYRQVEFPENAEEA